MSLPNLRSITNSRRQRTVFIFALLAFVATDASIFRSGFYQRYIKLVSSAGIYQFRETQARSLIKESPNLVGVIGDSRVSEGFSPRICDTFLSPISYRAITLGMPGSSPRVWSYLLSQIDPNRSAFKTIVFALPSYWDFDEYEDMANRVLDLQFVTPFLPISQAADLISTYGTFDTQGEAASCALLRMHAARRDLVDFMQNPQARIANLKFHRHFNDYNMPGSNHRLADFLNADKNELAQHPDEEEVLKRLDDRIRKPLPPQTGKRHQYMSVWLNRFAEAYSNSETKLVFIKLPSDPIKRPYEIPHLYSAVNDLKDRPNILVTPENLFADLEKPEYFGDDLHLNKFGRAIFTERLSKLLASKLQDHGSLAARPDARSQ